MRRIALRFKSALRGLVMRAGKVVEQGPADEILERPRDPYTRALMAAAFDLREAAE